jgi:neutral trehalase
MPMTSFDMDLQEQQFGRIRNGNRIYILSNRTFPGDSTNKLSRENIREDIQAIILCN